MLGVVQRGELGWRGGGVEVVGRTWGQGEVDLGQRASQGITDIPSMMKRGTGRLGLVLGGSQARFQTRLFVTVLLFGSTVHCVQLVIYFSKCGYITVFSWTGTESRWSGWKCDPSLV